MAKPVSEEELQLKKRARRRLIGAIALVAGTAAVLPMVLDSEPKPTSQDIKIQIPSPEVKGAITSKVVPVPPRTEATPAAKPASNAVDAAPAAKPEAAPSPKPETAPSSKPEAAPSSKPAIEKAALKPVEKAPEKAPEKTAEAKAKPGKFYIQIVALSEMDKAKQVQQQVNEAGLRSYTETVTTESGKVTRVRAGPFATREAAERARTKLKGIGLDGKIAGN